MEKTYLHTGIPVKAKMDGMNFMEALRVWICNNEEYGIEYLYWEKDTPAAYRMVKETHVAYKVADVEAAVKESGGKVLLRIEDLDAARCPFMGENTKYLLDDLAWLDSRSTARCFGSRGAPKFMIRILRN